MPCRSWKVTLGLTGASTTPTRRAYGKSTRGRRPRALRPDNAALLVIKLQGPGSLRAPVETGQCRVAPGRSLWA